MLMDNKNRLQILAYYLDGSVQMWGYDGKWFDDYNAVLTDIAKDFPTDFFDHYKNVVGMRLVWNNGDDTKEIQPTCGEPLLQAVAEWLTELGEYENGN